MTKTKIVSAIIVGVIALVLVVWAIATPSSAAPVNKGITSPAVSTLDSMPDVGPIESTEEWTVTTATGTNTTTHREFKSPEAGQLELRRLELELKLGGKEDSKGMLWWKTQKSAATPPPVTTVVTQVVERHYFYTNTVTPTPPPPPHQKVQVDVNVTGSPVAVTQAAPQPVAVCPPQPPPVVIYRHCPDRVVTSTVWY